MRSKWEKIVSRVRSAFDSRDAEPAVVDHVFKVFFDQFNRFLVVRGSFREFVKLALTRGCEREAWNEPMTDLVKRLMEEFNIPKEGLDKVCRVVQEIMDVFHRLAMGDEAFRGILNDYLAELTIRR